MGFIAWTPVACYLLPRMYCAQHVATSLTLQFTAFHMLDSSPISYHSSNNFPLGSGSAPNVLTFWPHFLLLQDWHIEFSAHLAPPVQQNGKLELQTAARCRMSVEFKSATPLCAINVIDIFPGSCQFPCVIVIQIECRRSSLDRPAALKTCRRVKEGGGQQWGRGKLGRQILKGCLVWACPRK